jgi:hypothetical protein
MTIIQRLLIRFGIFSHPLDQISSAIAVATLVKIGILSHPHDQVSSAIAVAMISVRMGHFIPVPTAFVYAKKTSLCRTEEALLSLKNLTCITRIPQVQTG